MRRYFVYAKKLAGIKKVSSAAAPKLKHAQNSKFSIEINFNRGWCQQCKILDFNKKKKSAQHQVSLKEKVKVVSAFCQKQGLFH